MSDELKQLHNEVAKELLLRIKSGEAKPADLAVAVKFLKDNEITALPLNENPLHQLMNNMPFPTQMELDEARRGN